MTNLNELMERREQINEDINNLFSVINHMKEAIIESLNENDFEYLTKVSHTLVKFNRKLSIMLEQNVTSQEAKAIIDAQSEEPAAEPKQEEAPVVNRYEGLNLTEKETATIDALIKGLYAEAGFTDVTDLDLVNATGIAAKSMRGVLGSLSKKGIIYVDTTAVEDINWQNKMEGEPKVEFNSFINLKEAHYNLHPEWAAEIAENA